MSLGMQILRGAMLALALLAGSAHAESQGGSLRLNDEAGTLTWTLTDTPPAPTLALALPTFAPLGNDGIEGPISIAVSTNYVAFIERWELALYRESDERRRHPIQLWRGAGASIEDGIEWDGSVAGGPPLRPGETVVASLRVRDVAGNIDQTKSQTLLVSRYLMPVQKLRLDRGTTKRYAALGKGNPPEKQTIPVSGMLFKAEIDSSATTEPMRIAGAAMTDLGEGRWRFAQILPAGTFSLNIQIARPIMGGSRLVPAGQVDVQVPQGSDIYAMVKGTDALERKPSTLDAPGLSRDGAITGAEAVRLTLWLPSDAEGRNALAVVDPAIPAHLYRTPNGRSVARISLPPRTNAWNVDAAPREPGKPIKMRALFPAGDYEKLTLPHTDIETDKFFVSMRSDNAPPVYLSAEGDYELEPSQGLVRLTDAGRAKIADLSQGGNPSFEVAYLVRPSFAGLGTRRPPAGVFEMQGDGSSPAQLFGADWPSDPAPTTAATSRPQPGWVARNLGWLMDG